MHEVGSSKVLLIQFITMPQSLSKEFSAERSGLTEIGHE